MNKNDDFEKKATLKDIAKYANVSLGTASKVMNNLHTSPQSKERVLNAMEKLNYTPNSIARSLKTNSSNTIGIMVSSTSNPAIYHVLTGIETICKQLGYHSMIFDTGHTQEGELNAISTFNNRIIDGIIYISHTLSVEVAEAIKKTGIPIVLVATKYDSDDFFTSITIDNETAAKEATQYLIAQGHTKIAMLAGKKDDPNAGIPRFSGYKKALAENNIPFDEDLVVFGGYRFKEGYETAQTLFDRNKEITAIFCASDEKAIGAYRYLYEKGLSIPDDISIIGFDGITMTNFMTPKLTTVKQPLISFGEKGMELLYKKIKKSAPVKNLILPYEFIINESVNFLK